VNYAKAFRVLRAASGHEQRELAPLIGITSSGLSLIEAGKRRPSLETVHSFAACIGVPAALVTLLASDPTELSEISSDTLKQFGAVLLHWMICVPETRP
jgi:DNA-binding XRE family transcriptional regulator